MTVITDIKQVLRKQGKNWQVITDNELLQSFFRSGDYRFWVKDGSSIEDVCGGNVMEWEFVDDEVHLQSSIQEDEDTPVEDWETCKIKKDILWDLINKASDTSWGE